MEKSRFIELIRKKESGEISLWELKELNEAIEDNPLYSSVFNNLQEISEMQPLFNKREDRVIKDELDLLKKKMNYRPLNKRTVYIKRLLAAAAAVLIVITVAAIFFNQHTKKIDPTNIIATQKGSKTTITLIDGTKVWVNADTKLTYDNTFGVKTRSVWLSGEAYFEVAKDKAHPFIVHTDLMEVTALGTAFNVRSYRDENNAETALMEGSVQIAFKKKEMGKILLKPMEKVVVRDPFVKADREKEQPEIAVVKVSYDSAQAVTAETGWLTNRLVFKQERLEQIIKTLERHYGCTIQVQKSALLDRKLSGIFKDESLMEVLETFRLAAGIQYTIDKNNVLLFN
jgi:ferric-dicitrate binding protein FerR (iron transport regulator)